MGWCDAYGGGARLCAGCPPCAHTIMDNWTATSLAADSLQHVGGYRVIAEIEMGNEIGLSIGHPPTLQVDPPTAIMIVILPMVLEE